MVAFSDALEIDLLYSIVATFTFGLLWSSDLKSAALAGCDWNKKTTMNLQVMQVINIDREEESRKCWCDFKLRH